MQQSLMKKRLIQTAIIAVIVLGLWAAPAEAHAALFSLTDIAANAIAWAINGLGYIIATVVSKLIGLFAGITAFTIDLNRNIISSVFVSDGWTITRDIANLGFVLIAIVIAIATIARYQQYTAKSLLVRLIAAAILVNFSLVIAGFILDFTQVLTDFFLSRIMSGDTDGLARALTGAFAPQKFLTTPATDFESQAAGAFSIVLAAIVNLGASIVFLTITLITIAALGVMFVVRYLWITFLLVIAPITWLFYVIPSMSGEFKRWWGNFIKWTFFAPAVSFFLYLSLVMAGTLTAEQSVSAAVPQSLVDILKNGLNAIVLAGLMLGGIIVAQSMGIAGASGAMKVVQGIGTGARNGIQKWAGNRAGAVTQKFAQTKAGVALQRQAEKLGKSATSIGKPVKTKTLWNPANWTSENLSQKAKNAALGITGTRAAASAVGAGLGATSGALKKSAGSKTIEPLSLAGSVSRGIAEGVGLFKKKPEAKKDEEKSIEELDKDIEGLNETLIDLKNKGIDTKAIDGQIKSKRNIMFKKQRENYETEWKSKDIDALNEEIGKIYQAPKVVKLDVNGVISIDDNTKFNTAIDEFVKGKKEADGTPVPGAGIDQLREATKEIDDQIKMIPANPSGAERIKKERLTAMQIKLGSKSTEKQYAAQTLLKIREEQEKAEKQREKALGSSTGGEEKPKIIPTTTEAEFKQAVEDPNRK